MSYDVVDNGETVFTCGYPAASFEFVFQVDALREFLELGGKALAEMDAQQVTDAAGQSVRVSG